jgi:hypothetical protein
LVLFERLSCVVGSMTLEVARMALGLGLGGILKLMIFLVNYLNIRELIGVVDVEPTDVA